MKNIIITFVCTLFIGFTAFAQSEAPVKAENIKAATEMEAKPAVEAEAATTEATKKSCDKKAGKASCCAHGKKGESGKASNMDKASTDEKALATASEEIAKKEGKKGCCSKKSAKASSCQGSKASSMVSAEEESTSEVQPAEPKVEKQ